MLLEDKGYVAFEVRGADGGVATITVDLWAAWSRVSDLSMAAGRKQGEWYAGVHALMDELGFAPRSTYLADRFVDAVMKAVDDLKKADGADSSPGSPAPTAPTRAG